MGEPLDDRSHDPPDDAPQRRKERGAAPAGSGDSGVDLVGQDPPGPPATPVDPRHREEVVGQGAGETAGGSPGHAVGEDSAAKRSDADLAFDPKQLIRGGGLSNTPPQKTTSGGEDYLTVNYYLEYESFEGIRTQLEDAKQASIEKRPGDTIQLGDVTGIVTPGGARLGSAEKGVYVPWCVTTDHGIKVLIADRPTPHKTQPSVQLRAASTPMMRFGFAGVLGLFGYVIEKLGGTVVANKVSRVDPSLDLPGVPVTDFTKPYDEGWCVTRARKRRRHNNGIANDSHADGRRATGVSVGKSPLGLRIYDKLYEVSRNSLKLEIIATSRWLGIPEHATRIEFQLGRARLKRLGVDTVEDWIAKRADVVNYLMSDWFRLTDGPVDRKHADRAGTHPKWLAAHDLFLECYGAPVGADLSPLPSIAIDPSQRIAVAVGVLKTAIVEMGYPIETNQDFLQVSLDLLDALVDDRDMAAEVARRAVEKGIGGLGLG